MIDFSNVKKIIILEGEVKKIENDVVVLWQKKTDYTKPVIKVKTGANETVGDFENKTFSKVSFKLYDNVGLREYEMNGVIRQISVSRWGDLNNVSIGNFNGIEGLNKLIVRDTSDNEATYEFTLISA